MLDTGIPGTTSVALADVNGDGIPDVIWAGNAVGVRLGLGGGRFQDPILYQFRGASSLGVADFNQDGIPDVALSTINGVALLFGTGDGHFSKQTVFQLGYTAGRLAVADLNGDGKPDIAIEVDGVLKILINPSFEHVERVVSVPFPPLLTKYNPLPVGLDGATPLVVDLNGDGQPDIVLADTSGLFTFLGKGDGTFTLAGSYPILAFAAAAGDFDGDGKPDLVVGRGDYVHNAFLSILRGRGDGTFETSIDVYSTFGLLPSVAVADFDQDGRPDIAVAEWSLDRVTVLRNTGPMTFTTLTFSAGKAPFEIVAGDFDRDGLPDLLAADYGVFYATGTISLFRGSGAQGFRIASGVPIDAEAGGVPKPVVVADFDGDGVPDIAASNYEFGISILLGTRNGLPRFVGTAEAGSAGTDLYPLVSALAAGDFNRDGLADLVFAGGNVASAQKTALLTSVGGGKFSPPKIIGPPATALAVCDFNGDGLLDVVAATPNGFVLLLGRGDGTFRQTSPVAAGLTVTSLVAEDIDGDGKCDIVFTTSSGVFWMRGGGDGSFGSAIQLADGQKDLGSIGGPEVTGLSASDLNGDGITDLIVLNSSVVYVLLGAGGGHFLAPTRVASAVHVTQALSADVNGDGHPDLLLLKPNINAIQILVGTGDGQFLPVGDTVVGTDSVSMAVADFDVDGRPDLAVSDTGPSGSGHITFLMNVCGKRESILPVRTSPHRPRVVRRSP